MKLNTRNMTMNLNVVNTLCIRLRSGFAISDGLDG